MQLRIFVMAIVLVLPFLPGSFLAPRSVRVENQPPVVRILAPAHNTTQSLNTPVRYKIKVSDPEDGESSFGEIPAGEVFLELRYFADSAAAKQAFQQSNAADPEGLAQIKLSNCLNCHAFSGKLIGPSFVEIARRYPISAAHIDSLAKHIRDGSVGTWGNVPMPTHPELTAATTKLMVEWILKNGPDQAVEYYRGVEGFFTLKSSSPAGSFLVKASYTDHGSTENKQIKRSGYDRLLIHGR